MRGRTDATTWPMSRLEFSSRPPIDRGRRVDDDDLGSEPAFPKHMTRAAAFVVARTGRERWAGIWQFLGGVSTPPRHRGGAALCASQRAAYSGLSPLRPDRLAAKGHLRPRSPRPHVRRPVEVGLNVIRHVEGEENDFPVQASP